MLILKRRVGESVVIGEHIYCKILSNEGNQILLGFDAPRELPINREEIHNRMQLEKERSEAALEIESKTIIEMMCAQFKKSEPTAPAQIMGCGRTYFEKTAGAIESPTY